MFPSYHHYTHYIPIMPYIYIYISITFSKSNLISIWIYLNLYKSTCHIHVNPLKLGSFHHASLIKPQVGWTTTARASWRNLAPTVSRWSPKRPDNSGRSSAQRRRNPTKRQLGDFWYRPQALGIFDLDLVRKNMARCGPGWNGMRGYLAGQVCY